MYRGVNLFIDCIDYICSYKFCKCFYFIGFFVDNEDVRGWYNSFLVFLKNLMLSMYFWYYKWCNKSNKYFSLVLNIY